MLCTRQRQSHKTQQVVVIVVLRQRNQCETPVIFINTQLSKPWHLNVCHHHSLPCQHRYLSCIYLQQVNCKLSLSLDAVGMTIEVGKNISLLSTPRQLSRKNLPLQPSSQCRQWCYSFSHSSDCSATALVFCRMRCSSTAAGNFSFTPDRRQRGYLNDVMSEIERERGKLGQHSLQGIPKRIY